VNAVVSGPGVPDAGTPTWSGLISSLIAREDLSRAQAAWAMDEVMTAEATPVQLAGFLVGSRAMRRAREQFHRSHTTGETPA